MNKKIEAKNKTDDWVNDQLTNRKKMIQLLADIFAIELGFAINSFGMAILYATNLGSSPMSTCSEGLHLLFHISYGDALMLANMVLLVIVFFLDRSTINVGTLLCVFTIGPWVNLFLPIMQSFGIADAPLAVRILLCAGGTVFIGAGVGLYMSVDRGYGALEGIVKYVRNRFGISVRVTKITQDALLVGFGVLLSAQWGIGTLIVIALTGPVLQVSAQLFRKRIALFRKRLAADEPA